MTRNLTRARAAVAMLVVAVLVAAGARLATDATDRTSAAWTDDVHATTSVSLGTWASHALGCVVIDRAGAETSSGATCEIASVSVDRIQWGEVGHRAANLIVALVPRGVSPGAGERLRVTVDLSTLGELPADWRWSTAGASGEIGAVDCSALPVLTFQARDWAGWGPSSVPFQLHETREPGDCSMQV